MNEIQKWMKFKKWMKMKIARKSVKRTTKHLRNLPRNLPWNHKCELRHLQQKTTKVVNLGTNKLHVKWFLSILCPKFDFHRRIQRWQRHLHRRCKFFDRQCSMTCLWPRICCGYWSFLHTKNLNERKKMNEKRK